MIKFNVSMEVAGGSHADQPNRLAKIFTGFTLDKPEIVELNLTDSETLFTALPELLTRAQEEADRILAEDNPQQPTRRKSH